MELLQEYLFPWTISNCIAIILLIVAIKKTKIARLLFTLMFSLACWVNLGMANNNPTTYLDYAMFTPFSFYADFINGWFSEHITTMVSLIAIGQGLIALGMLLKGSFVRLAGVGAIVFLLAISPLGVGAAFPFSITTIVAIYFILKKDDLNYIWKWRRGERMENLVAE